MKAGSGDRYFQDPRHKLVPEGIEGMVPYKGSLADTVYQLIGGLRQVWVIVGPKDIQELQNNTEFVRMTGGRSCARAIPMTL